jgi:hypothetical protein
MYRTGLIGCVSFVLLSAPATAWAGAGSKLLQEALEYAGKKFGKEVAEEGVETLAARMAKLAAKHGDEMVAAAFRKVGPRAGRVVGEAGERGGIALRLLAQHGDDALPLVAKASSLNAVAHFGDDAATAIIKHGPVGERLVEEFALEGAEALAKVTPRNGRRLAMMATEGQLKPELLTVIKRYGDGACDFIWKNKGALAVGATLATFVASPGEFLDGTQKLTAVVAEAAIKPLAEVPKTIATEAAKNMNWTLLVLVATVVLGAFAYFRMSAGRRVSRLTERWLQNEIAPESPQKK